MKREKLQHVSLDDQRRQRLVSQLIKRGKEPVSNVIAWYDELSDDDKEALIIGVDVGLIEMVNSIKNLAASITPLLGAMMRDLKTRGKEADHANT